MSFQCFCVILQNSPSCIDFLQLFFTFAKIVHDLGLDDELIAAEAATIFAPFDYVFRDLPPETLAVLKNASDPFTREVMLRHIVVGKALTVADMVPGPLETYGGQVVDVIESDHPGCKFKMAYKADINPIKSCLNFPDTKVCNGVIHGMTKIFL